MPSERFYSEDEADAILREAARSHLPDQSAITHDQLVQTAAELGISVEAVESARKRIEDRKALDFDRMEYVLSRRSKLRDNLSSWLGISVMLICINLFTNGFSFQASALWCIWPIGILGAFLLMDVVDYFVRRPESDEAAFQKWREKKLRKQQLIGTFLPGQVQQSRVDLVLDHFFATHEADDRAGAIRTVRDQTGLGLREAKALVEEYCRTRGLA